MSYQGKCPGPRRQLIFCLDVYVVGQESDCDAHEQSLIAQQTESYILEVHTVHLSANTKHF